MAAGAGTSAAPVAARGGQGQAAGMFSLYAQEDAATVADDKEDAAKGLTVAVRSDTLPSPFHLAAARTTHKACLDRLLPVMHAMLRHT